MKRLIIFRAYMKLRKSYIITGILAVLVIGIHLYAQDPLRVENQYATGIFPAFGRFLRYLFGWLPFSFGDLVYGLVVLWLIWKTGKALKALFEKRVNKATFLSGCGKTVRILLVTYIVFNLCWGINYNRTGIAGQLQLKIEEYSVDDLKKLNALLVEKTNSSKRAFIEDYDQYPSKMQLFSKVTKAYTMAEKQYRFLKYHPVSLKPSIWSWVGNYFGFTGYYNPFTGEAQVNTLVPEFLQPFTTCHEVAHQLGYAKEMEANFVAYLAATSTKDPLLHYSVYLDLFIYSNRSLYDTDSTAAIGYRSLLSTAVQSDLQTWRTFNEKHRNPIEPLIRWGYGKYLERNQQPQGVFSYDAVTGFMIAWYRKHKEI